MPKCESQEFFGKRTEEIDPRPSERLSGPITMLQIQRSKLIDVKIVIDGRSGRKEQISFEIIIYYR